MADQYLSTLTVGGVTYGLRDDDARELIAAIQGGILSFIVSTNAATTPQGVTWGNVTGTLAASSTTVGKIYLVPASAGGKDAYAEYVTVTTGTEQSPTYAWEQLGTTNVDLSNLGTLAYKDTVTLNQHTTSINNISAASLTGTGVTVTPTTTKLSVSNAADTTSKALTGLGTPSKTAFVTSYPGATSKLVKTSITPADSLSIPVVNIDNASVSIPNVTSAGSASTWSFTTTETTSGSGIYNLTITGGNGTAPTLGTAITASKVSQGTALSGAKVGTAVDVATGALSGTGTGDSVMTGLGNAVTSDAITAITPTDSDFVTASGAASLASGDTGTEVMTGASAAVTSGAVTLTSTSVSLLDTQTTVTVS